MKNKLRITNIFLGLFILTWQVAAAQPEKPKPSIPPAPSPDAVSPEQARADAAWKKVGTITDAPEPVNGARTYSEATKKFGDGSREGFLKSPDFWKWWSLRRLQFREEGLKFWHDFPNDKRRYVWLFQTIWTPPFYWKDPEQAARSAFPTKAAVDEAALKAWDDMYLPMRAEFIASPLVAADLRVYLLWSELMQDGFNIDRLGLTPYARAVYVRQLNARLQDLDREPALPDHFVSQAANMILQTINRDAATEASFIEVLKLSKRTDVQLFANGREQVAKLRSNPFELAAATMTGEKIDVAKLRGKFVLVDIWSNNCGGCIAAMPHLEATYEKYRKQGFEVVGVWITTDETMEKPEAQKILAKQGVTYPNVVLTGPTYTEFIKKYSIISVPVTFLLDKNGHLITNNVSGSTVDEQVRRLVGPQETK